MRIPTDTVLRGTTLNHHLDVKGNIKRSEILIFNFQFFSRTPEISSTFIAVSRFCNREKRTLPTAEKRINESKTRLKGFPCNSLLGYFKAPIIWSTREKKHRTCAA